MDIQRLRNLTTRRLHTEMGHIYEDLGTITGERGLMTHMLPRVLESVTPWLREHVIDNRFWDGKYDTTHVGEIELPESTEDDRKAMFERYKALPNPLEGKNVIVAVVGDETGEDNGETDLPTSP
ncbi:MAG: hypothetical protein FJ276_19300 [Planctomycetes bacterium]|nr:hypothetical protein [Planctomycetota bacterium]